MFERFGRKSIQTTAAALLAAGGVAGIASAQGRGSAAQPTAHHAAQAQAADPAGPNDKPDSTTDPTGPNDKADGTNDPADTNDKADGQNEKADSQNEKADNESSPEVAGNDGPGGHADEPGNPNANTHQQGQH